jgi:hypothetical protein
MATHEESYIKGFKDGEYKGKILASLFWGVLILIIAILKYYGI